MTSRSLKVSETRRICYSFIIITISSKGVLGTSLRASTLLPSRLRASLVLVSFAATVRRISQVLTVLTTIRFDCSCCASMFSACFVYGADVLDLNCGVCVQDPLALARTVTHPRSQRCTCTAFSIMRACESIAGVKRC